MIVIFPEFDEDVGPLFDDAVARADDAWWIRYVYAEFSWQRFMDWWAARRWIVPRDVRKQ